MTNLNADQEAAAQALFDFLLDSTQKEFSISGPAGVGKTYLLQYLYQRIMPMYADACKMVNIQQTINNIVFTAMTNRAADVLTKTMGQSAQTTHSFMNLKVYDDYSTGRQKIQKKASFTVHENTIIVIDEASMVDYELYRILHEGTSSTCKLVYVGDRNQIAPVGEKLSMVWNPSIPSVNLTIPMRNAGQPALINLCNQFRTTVETGQFFPITLVPGVIEHLDGPAMQDHVDRVFLPIEHSSRILSYTNQNSKSFNDYIRTIRGYTGRYDTGEIVVLNKAFDVTKNNTISAEQEFVIKRDSNLSDETFDFDGMPVVCYKIEITSLKTNDTYSVYQADDPDYLSKVSNYFRSHKDWSNYFRLTNLIPDLRPRDASTVHKAQGSSYNSVYIDLDDIGSCNIKEQVARMLYVAVSRARNKIYFYGKLPDKYLGG